MKKIIDIAYTCFFSGLIVGLVLSIGLSAYPGNYVTMSGHEYIFNQRLALQGDCTALKKLVLYESQQKTEFNKFLKNLYEEDYIQRSCKG